MRNAGRELGVRYVMQGSLRRLDQKLRVNVALIDTTTGGHLWADRYDTGYEDLFTPRGRHRQQRRPQAGAQGDRQPAGRHRRSVRPPRSPPTTPIAAAGPMHCARPPTGLAEALKLFRQAVTIDPDYARAQAAIGLVYWNAWIWGWESSVGETWETAPMRAEEHAKLALRRPTATAYQLASQINLYARSTTRRGVSPSWPSTSTPRTPAARWRWPR